MIDKSGKVLAAEPGSPAGTVEAVKRLIGGGGVASTPGTEAPKTEAAVPTGKVVNGTNGATKEDVAQANTAAQVADTAEKLDSNEAKPVAL